MRPPPDPFDEFLRQVDSLIPAEEIDRVLGEGLRPAKEPPRKGVKYD